MTKPNEMTGNAKCWHVRDRATGKVVVSGPLTKKAARNMAAKHMDAGGGLATICLEGYHFIPCPGEAHSNPHIDNCGLCMPRWGVLMVPESCTTVEAAREAGAL